MRRNEDDIQKATAVLCLYRAGDRLRTCPHGAQRRSCVGINIFDAFLLAIAHAAEKAASEISELFTSVYGKPEKAKEIALESSVAVADTHLSLADLRRVDQWRLEYMSLRADPPEDFLAVGETPA
ncbi:hypothetical protein [Paraburkholderia atlantica]|uniref:hypothetical protein n=1 Tax=Paraburkholderia atlantica TaxID=2654982 RepID=UPI001619A6D4|nr:hypothetical protein [Paraburkholderia atlantica]MBB5421799.1 hypothetical protein [Paraburkholderia atlantica]